ncbi:hypothetical protein E3N88_28358 [Mikania micrantha]|uniref:SWIM-type domain-containing protein n=1 Tax=Mikania micrantha TaxID=192012 RepID=A0A5N6N0F4_9ASTR|nr:hypothetical protein E3N88_28358 [Mikania micrantha]
MGGGDQNMADVLEDHGSVQVDNVLAGQDFGHGGVHDRDDDELDDNDYGEGDLNIDRLDPLADDTFDILVGNSPLRYIGCDRSGSHSFLIYQTPNGTRFWCPDVISDQKPMVGKIYDSWDEVYKMYETYAELSGFGIRISGCKKWKGQITHRILVCNKAGKPRNKKYDTLDPGSLGCSRGRSFKVTDCKALIRLKAIKGEPKYLLYEFVENHNHELISSDNMDLTRKGRHLNFEDIQFVHKMSLNKVGPTVAHRLQTALKGGHHNMRGTRSAFKNVSRDIRMFIGDRDIQLVVQKLEEPIDNQRYNQRILEFQTSNSKPDLRCGLDIEAHAYEIYTHSVFKDVQKEIFKGMMNCFISNVDVVDHSKVFSISHMDHNMDFVNEFKVSAHMHDNSVECTCIGFSRNGYLCRHVFCVLRVMKIKEIPDRYVAKRWRRQILPCRVYSISNRLAADDSKESILKNQAMNCVSDCVDKLTGSFESLSAFVDKMKDIQKSVFDENPGVSNPRKRAVAIEELVGNVDETAVMFTPPQGIRNKGCGTNRRLVGQGERATEKSKKNPRLCRSCNQLTFHDSRNCKLRSDNGSSS